MVAVETSECPKPIAWPISCVKTSARLHSFQLKQPCQPSLMETLPTTMREKRTPLTTFVCPVVQ
jgi:hypothetical protein